MASSLGIGCGGNNNVGIGQKLRAENGRNLSLRPVSLAIRDRSIGWRRSYGRVATATKLTTKAMVVTRSSMDLAALGNFDEEDQGGSETAAVEACERLDEWMRKSVVEIVKNLNEAPLLVQVYQDKRSDNGCGTRTRRTTTTLNTEKKAVEADWPDVKEKWETGEIPLPDGLIFVEEISSEESENEEQETIGGGGHLHGDGRSQTTTRAWGVVVQGKGMGCGPVCYLLKTSRVGAGSGLGLYCTHFCLVRVKNFMETAQSQLKNCWLLQSQ